MKVAAVRLWLDLALDSFLVLRIVPVFFMNDFFDIDVNRKQSAMEVNSALVGRGPSRTAFQVAVFN